MTIQEVYSKYKVPTNLQRHMLRVAGVTKLVSENVTGIDVNADMAIKAALLHDMGNILKFDLSNPKLLDDEDKVRVEELMQVQRELASKYDPNCNTTTILIMREMGCDEKMIEICEQSHGKNSEHLVDSEKWEQKIVYYADMRVGPFGVMSVEERFEDLMNRYTNREDEMEMFQKRCLRIEQQLQKVAKINVRMMGNNEVDGAAKVLRTTLF